MQPTRNKTAIVIGANGAFGKAVAIALRKRRWRITGFARKAQPDLIYDSFIEGDALSTAEVSAACQGQSLIIHAVNPPYPKWASEALPMLENTIAAAKSSGATILFPGNIYNFGPDAGEVLTEDAPQNPATSKGKIRVTMEHALSNAAAYGVNIVVLRCADFFGPGATSTWFEAGLFSGKPGVPKSIAYPGDLSVGHTWAYLPDVGEAAARLIETREPNGFEVFNFPGHFVPTGRDLVTPINAAIAEKTGNPVPLKAVPWGFMQLLRPFVPMINQLFEMRYLWAVPHRLDGLKLEAAIGPIPHTPLKDAVCATLASRLK
jgi:nucleoside-diphosphate-sugar epimerase